MKSSFFAIIIFTAFIVENQTLFAQHSQPSTIQPIKISGKINFDGILNDSIWQETTHISNFTLEK